MYVPLVEIFVVLLAGVFHNFPIGPEGKNALIGPRLGKGLLVFQGDLVGDVFIVGTREPLDGMQRVTVRVSDGIEVGFVVEGDRVDYQSIAVPRTDMVSKPGRIGV